METIRNYLESMFANLPRTADVERAKAELLQMMEDKYSELIEEGKSENEAVGTVISEFGNLDELAESLGLEKEVEEACEIIEANPRRMLILDEVKDFLSFSATRATSIALGVALYILSVNGPIFFGALGLENTGAVIMFLMIFAAVAIFVFTGLQSAKWSYFKKELCSVDYATSNYVINEKERYKASYGAQLVAGILLCAACWIPTVILDDVARLTGAGNDSVSVILLFIMVAVGVFLIIHTSMVMGSYNDVLKINDRDTMSGSYSRGSVPEYAGPAMEKVMSVYWPTVRTIYLVWCFLTFAWWRTWVIWPMAGIIFAVLKGLSKNSSNNAAEVK